MERKSSKDLNYFWGSNTSLGGIMHRMLSLPKRHVTHDIELAEFRDALPGTTPVLSIEASLSPVVEETDLCSSVENGSSHSDDRCLFTDIFERTPESISDRNSEEWFEIGSPKRPLEEEAEVPDYLIDLNDLATRLERITSDISDTSTPIIKDMAVPDFPDSQDEEISVFEPEEDPFYSPFNYWPSSESNSNMLVFDETCAKKGEEATAARKKPKMENNTARKMSGKLPSALSILTRGSTPPYEKFVNSSDEDEEDITDKEMASTTLLQDVCEDSDSLAEENTPAVVKQDSELNKLEKLKEDKKKKGKGKGRVLSCLLS